MTRIKYLSIFVLNILLFPLFCLSTGIMNLFAFLNDFALEISINGDRYQNSKARENK